MTKSRNTAIANTLGGNIISKIAYQNKTKHSIRKEVKVERNTLWTEPFMMKIIECKTEHVFDTCLYKRKQELETAYKHNGKYMTISE